MPNLAAVGRFVIAVVFNGVVTCAARDCYVCNIVVKGIVIISQGDNCRSTRFVDVKFFSVRADECNCPVSDRHDNIRAANLSGVRAAGYRKSIRFVETVDNIVAIAGIVLD